jgi:hypothetical protein
MTRATTAIALHHNTPIHYPANTTISLDLTTLSPFSTMYRESGYAPGYHIKNSKVPKMDQIVTMLFLHYPRKDKNLATS